MQDNIKFSTMYIAVKWAICMYVQNLCIVIGEPKQAMHTIILYNISITICCTVISNVAINTHKFAPVGQQQ